MDIKGIRGFITSQLNEDKTGHAMDHIRRVERTAKDILQTEPTADSDLTIAIVLLHEIFDEKLNLNIDKTRLITCLKEWGLTNSQIENLLDAITYLSFSKNIDQTHLLSLEGQIAQDADRIDAIGALGVARAFYYGGAIGQPLYDNQQINQNTTQTNHEKIATCIGHFDEKLLKIYSLINTQRGREIARERHQFLLDFKDQFYKEIYALD